MNCTFFCLQSEENQYNKNETNHSGVINMSERLFHDYPFKDTTKALIRLNQFIKPTVIQQEVIPLAIAGKDIIGISATGTGKTHAFLIPIMEMIDVNKDEVQAVITVPTRELALQLYERAKLMQEVDEKLRVRLISGGIEKSKMNDSLRLQPHIIIGTPGRIRDLFLNEQTLLLQNVKILVVDEADMTWEFGFLEDIDVVASRMSRELQMMSFSATIPEGLKPFLKKYMTHPTIVNVKKDEQFQPRIEHILVPCRPMDYAQKVLSILPTFHPYVCLIFANTRSEAANLAQLMRDHGYGVIELHGDLTPRERTRAMKKLMQLDQSYVVATDIAARGIDIEGVSHVISMGFPKELDYYIHRSGRTGRSGSEGICYALYQDEEEAAIKALQKRGIEFHHRQLKQGRWVDLKPKQDKRVKKDDPLAVEIGKIMSRRTKKVKPGYKAKRKQEVEKLRRKAKRELIQKDIQRQKKERAKARQLEKRGDNR